MSRTRRPETDPDRTRTVRACLTRLRSLYPSLKPAEQRVADFLLHQPGDVLGLSITELADRCSVSEATVVRLCQNMGYRGYQEVRLLFAQDAGLAAHDIHQEVQISDSTPTVVSKVFHAAGQALQDCQSVLVYEEFERAADAIVKAGSVQLYGVGGSGALAFDAAHKFLKTGLQVSAYNDAHMAAMSASLLKKGSVAIGISHSGTTLDVIHALTVARDAGGVTICLTGYDRSPITQVCDIKLVTGSQANSLWGEATVARVMQLVALDALYVAVSMRRYEKSLAAIEKTSRAVASKRL